MSGEEKPVEHRPLRVATLFSGVGAFEQALKQMGVNHRIVFACDNGERYLKTTQAEIVEATQGFGQTGTPTGSTGIRFILPAKKRGRFSLRNLSF